VTLSRSQLAGGILAGILAIAVATALVLLNSPEEERGLRLDAQRVRDLEGLSLAIDLYWSRLGELPASLDDLGKEVGSSAGFTDPATASMYEYRALAGEVFELCARFDTAGQQGTEALVEDRFWTHHAGRQCFRREAKKVR
jgi:hypothetical protein